MKFSQTNFLQEFFSKESAKISSGVKEDFEKKQSFPDFGFA